MGQLAGAWLLTVPWARIRSTLELPGSNRPAVGIEKRDRLDVGTAAREQQTDMDHFARRVELQAMFYEFLRGGAGKIYPLRIDKIALAGNSPRYARLAGLKATQADDGCQLSWQIELAERHKGWLCVCRLRPYLQRIAVPLQPAISDQPTQGGG